MLLRAWRSSGLSAPAAALVLVGDGPIRARAVATGAAVLEDALGPDALRDLYAGSDVVVVPSIPTRDFLEPWGLVANEAFNQGVPVIATDAVGAAAGGLIEHERTGLVVPAGDADALARRAAAPARRPRAARAPRRARRAPPSPRYTHDAWAAGMARALAAAGAGRRKVAASVLRLMLRPALIALLALLLAAPTALRRRDPQQDPARVPDDGSLTGDYTAREIRDARNNIPDDLDQYTDCRDVLTRALLEPRRRRLGRRRRHGGGGTTGGGGGDGGGGERRRAADAVDRRRPAGARRGPPTRGERAARGRRPPGRRRASRPSATTCRRRCSSLLALLAAAAVAGLAPHAPPARALARRASDVSSLADPVSRPQRRTITIPLPRVAGNGMLATGDRGRDRRARRSRPPAGCGSSARPTS